MCSKFYSPKTTIAELVTSESYKVILCAYNSSCIPQLGVCGMTIMYKDIQNHEYSLHYLEEGKCY